MSLRAWLSLVFALALVALSIAGLAIWGTVRARNAEAVRRAEDSSVAATEGLVRAYRRLPSTALQATGDAREAALRGAAALVLEPVLATRGGYCWPDGTLIQEDSASMHPLGATAGAPPPFFTEPPPNAPPPPHHPPGPLTVSPPPPPDVHSVFQRDCAKLKAGQIQRTQIERSNHTNVIVVIGMGGGVAAFTSRIVPMPQPYGPSWRVQIVVMALITFTMVGLTLATTSALRSGARDLDRVLARLESDLRADTERPRTREFGAIAARVRSMARGLADARDRERALERQIAHKDRLSVLGRAAAGAAHEIRNPLTGIKLLLDGMLRRSLDDRTHDEVAACLEEIGRLDHVVGALLGVARDPRATIELIDVDALVDQRAALLGPHARARGVQIQRSGQAQLNGERAALVQVVDNLLRNAIDASSSGQRVAIEIAERDEFVRIAVIDRGPGVPVKIEQELFEPFTSAKENGTGLGLWVSQTLVTSRGGELRYHRDGGETHFVVAWPRSPADEPTARSGGG